MTTLELLCLRCQHKWLRRDLEKLPATCPKCRSPYWQKALRAPSKSPSAVYRRAKRAGDEAAAAKALKAIKRARRAPKKKPTKL